MNIPTKYIVEYNDYLPYSGDIICRGMNNFL